LVLEIKQLLNFQDANIESAGGGKKNVIQKGGLEGRKGKEGQIGHIGQISQMGQIGLKGSM